MKIWADSRWYFDQAKDSWCLTKPGEHEPGLSDIEVMIKIQSRDVEALIKELDKNGWIKPRLDERLRAEDLKITHRLLDIIQAQISQAKE